MSWGLAISLWASVSASAQAESMATVATPSTPPPAPVRHVLLVEVPVAVKAGFMGEVRAVVQSTFVLHGPLDLARVQLCSVEMDTPVAVGKATPASVADHGSPSITFARSADGVLRADGTRGLSSHGPVTMELSIKGFGFARSVSEVAGNLELVVDSDGLAVKRGRALYTKMRERMIELKPDLFGVTLIERKAAQGTFVLTRLAPADVVAGCG
jgi:hypothetical protein